MRIGRMLAAAMITLTVTTAVAAPPVKGQPSERYMPEFGRPTTLKVGDPAPAVKAQWLKGQAPDFSDGKVHVVEFWATWCGPCRENMPYLSELARKYRGKVVVTSFNIWELVHAATRHAPYKDEVISFVDHAGPMMDHAVGMDVDDFMSNNWMVAAGKRGIPTAFIIDKHGKYIWAGHPGQLEDAVELALEDKLDAAATARLQAEFKAGFDAQNKLVKEARAALEADKVDEALRLSDEAAKINVSGPAAVATLTYAAYMKKSKEAGRAHMEQLLKTFANAPYTLRTLARAAQKDDPDLAVKLLEAAVARSRPTDPVFQLDLAKAYAAVGDYARAADSQEKALVGMNNPAIEDFKPGVEAQTKVLNEYREKANMPATRTSSGLEIADPSELGPMTLNAILTQPHAAPDDSVSVLVGVKLLPGWHTYAVVPANEPYIQTKFSLDPGPGITASGGWIMPPPVNDGQNPELKLYESTAEPLVFKHSLRVANDASGEVTVRVGVIFQVCDAFRCLPPEKKTFDLKLEVAAR